MVTLKVLNMEGADQGVMEVGDGVFDVPLNESLIHDVAVGLMHAQRQGTHDSKTRSEVAGGGKKPFRQKGTGRARRGSTREPHLRGGGAVFGPHPRDYRQNISTGMKRKALCGVLSDRTRNDRLCVLSDLRVAAPKTRPVARMIKKIVPESRRTLVVTADYDVVLLTSSRNVPNLSVRTAADVNALDVLRASHVLVQREAVPKLEERLS